MTIQHVFFAGGGTGGHIYPALAIAQQIKKLHPATGITFFCSDRKIDSEILSKTGFDFVPLSAIGFSANPVNCAKFMLASYKSYKQSKAIIREKLPAALVGVGGFVSAGPVIAAHNLRIPVSMVNTDSVPGKANKFLARYVDQIFAQFDFTRGFFGKCKEKVQITGCPLRPEFMNPDREKVFKELTLDPAKKVLLITGASTGARSINQAVSAILDKLTAFGGEWQVVHLTGKADFEAVRKDYTGCRMPHKVIDYYDQMADMLAAADLVIGRAGAVSVAEFAAAGVPAICMPYPYHKDNHQRTNALQLEKAGCAIIIDDKIDAPSNAVQLWPILQKLMSDENAFGNMRESAKKFGINNAALEIAKRILNA